ncbi:DUF1932 domain-containing protein [Microbacterium invictum]|uniref:3-hydroxyisobutyrate dehydrogenase-like beta-hydroxyacid dehydrogenase n=1 Tax=Microbacterium invictum TaxID=515415 RepID=A0AA40VN10_9MICO|nr:MULTISPECIES: NAD(P)-dependent oxidoreductase [Microbacterium]MBB4140954.1 3-hydroxyisobutyrate dehydrogenase-like beta-hydroxyacid dehydrogenase [Microbacterium invictum]
MTTITILGLGEAGSRYARGLAGAGAEVRGYDPAHELGDPAVTQTPTLEEALAGADVVVSLVAGHIAASIADDALPHVRAGAVYADLNSGAPEVKQRIASAAAVRGVLMADVAVLAPVVRAGHRTPLLASGDGATTLADALAPFGVPVDVLEGPAGDASRLRLLRSVFMKGLAALTLEGLTAAQAIGAEDWLRGQIAAELGPDGDALLERLVDGSGQHAVRRAHEVRAAVAALEALGTPADMSRATLEWLERLATPRDA